MTRRPRFRNRAATRWLRCLIGDRRAATAVEYGLILALVVLAVMASLIGVADVTTNLWGDISTKVQNAR